MPDLMSSMAGSRINLRTSATAPRRSTSNAAFEVTIPLWWAGDEPLEVMWASTDYRFEPQAITRVKALLTHERDSFGRVLFERPFITLVDAADVTRALLDDYYMRGLVSLMGDESDVQRKRDARVRYNKWRSESYAKLIQQHHEVLKRHHEACARARAMNLQAPEPPAEYESALSFIKSSRGDGLQKRFICQLDGSGHPTRAAALARVAEIDPRQVNDPTAVLDTLPNAVAAELGEPASTPSAVQSLQTDITAAVARADAAQIDIPDAVRSAFASTDPAVLKDALAAVEELLAE